MNTEKVDGSMGLNVSDYITEGKLQQRVITSVTEEVDENVEKVDGNVGIEVGKNEQQQWARVSIPSSVRLGFQLLETPFLNLVNYASLLATNAARHRFVNGKSKVLLEFGLRRAQVVDFILAPDVGTCLSISISENLGDCLEFQFGGLIRMLLLALPWYLPINSKSLVIEQCLQFDCVLSPLCMGPSEHLDHLKCKSSSESLKPPGYRIMPPIGLHSPYEIIEKSLRSMMVQVLARILLACELGAITLYALAFASGFLALVDTYDVFKRVVQEKLPEGVNMNGLTLTGFLFLHALFIEKGHLETKWTVLQKFGYDNDIKMRDDLIPSVNCAPDQLYPLEMVIIIYYGARVVRTAIFQAQLHLVVINFSSCHCNHFVGSHDASLPCRYYGKSDLHLICWPFSDNCTPTTDERYVGNVVDQPALLAVACLSLVAKLEKTTMLLSVHLQLSEIAAVIAIAISGEVQTVDIEKFISCFIDIEKDASMNPSDENKREIEDDCDYPFVLKEDIGGNNASTTRKQSAAVLTEKSSGEENADANKENPVEEPKKKGPEEKCDQEELAPTSEYKCDRAGGGEYQGGLKYGFKCRSIGDSIVKSSGVVATL
ncbi:EF hand associated, type-2 [Dillenia turbinata]|uniref:nicotinate phosphoribosyltransferase n=1 Tax=Dillenia turbinata TaxID=194707 RepID=A0AAN8WE89_9MAGN